MSVCQSERVMGIKQVPGGARSWRPGGARRTLAFDLRRLITFQCITVSHARLSISSSPEVSSRHTEDLRLLFFELIPDR